MSVRGAFCIPREAKRCRWSGQLSHPEDLAVCNLTGITFRREYTDVGSQILLQPLARLLDGAQRPADRTDSWPALASKIGGELSVRRCSVEAAQLSPEGDLLAMSLELPGFLGLGTQYAGCLYSVPDQAIVGRIVRGKRKAGMWTAARH